MKTLAFEADDDRVTLARVLVDGRVLREPELCDEELLLADEHPGDDAHTPLEGERIPAEAWEGADVDVHLADSEA